jgi:hypothetical protein
MALTKVLSTMLDLRANTNQGDSNTVAGIDALLNTPAAPPSGQDSQKNTAFGYEALEANDLGYSNTAVGYQALKAANTVAAAAQTAVGANALASSTTGGGNTAIGFDACYKNTTGTANLGIGKGALYSNNTGSYNIAIGLDAFGTGTFPAAGKSGDFNVAIGTNAMTQAIASDDNVAIGNEASISQTTLLNTVAIGSGALRGDANLTATNSVTGTTAVGFRSGFIAGTAFNNNTLLGAYTGYHGTTGDQNVAVGTSALYGLAGTQVFSQNVAVGFQSMYNATSAQENVAIGQNSLFNAGNTSGSVAVGLDALYTAGNGSLNNTGVGNSAGKFISTGDNNTCLGYFAGTNASPFYITSENNRVVIGDTNVTNAYIQVAWTVVSDERDKADIEDVSYGLDFVSKLRPVKFKRDNRNRYEDRVSDGSKKDQNYTYGFLAQNVIEAEKACGATDETLLVANNEDVDNLKLVETSMIPALVNAINQLKAEFEAYKAIHP